MNVDYIGFNSAVDRPMIFSRRLQGLGTLHYLSEAHTEAELKPDLFIVS